MTLSSSPNTDLGAAGYISDYKQTPLSNKCEGEGKPARHKVAAAGRCRIKAKQNSVAFVETFSCGVTPELKRGGQAEGRNDDSLHLETGDMYRVYSCRTFDIGIMIPKNTHLNFIAITCP